MGIWIFTPVEGGMVVGTSSQAVSASLRRIAECFAFVYDCAQTGWLVASTGQQPSQQVSLALRSAPHQLPA